MSSTTLAEYEQHAIEILKDLTQDWDSGFGGDITPSTSIVSELEFESIDVVHLVTAIEQRYERSDLAFEELLMVEGRYVEDLKVSDIANFLHKHLG